MSDFEREDMELAAMMGDKFIDETVPLAEMPESDKGYTDIPKPKKSAQKPTEAQWMPKQRNWLDDLKDCCAVLFFAGLDFAIWCWQGAGLMEESLALPWMLACTFIAGIKTCKVLGGKR